ncbi:pirin family protein [Asticcacaulis sp. EMRT-3]|uniref:pirin family protein n=1 Tax=Asticcacaulis sp. EMRT-3 TaxID=3040349 RepID=UPI0024AF739B|nr:pirin family protein [Asticcacaulis sp. EMRT-3]MDI7774491.1 pirin family protein [Asticcacaulis sp. EMRT-3]
MFMKAQPQLHKGQRIRQIVRGIPSSDNAGTHLHRVIGTEALDQIDPFLLFEDLRPAKAQSELIEHPHAGFEILTLVVDGAVDHSTAGQTGRIVKGGGHWITAGRGISHGVQPVGEGARAFQIWLNLPAVEERLEPVAREIAPADIPAVIFAKAEVRVLAGRFHGLIGPVASAHTQPFIADIVLGHEGEISLPLPEGHQGFIYVSDGGVAVEQSLINAGQAGLIDGTADDGANLVNLVAGQDGARLFVATALPLNTPVVRYGPFVMADHEGIKQTFIDYQNGLF